MRASVHFIDWQMFLDLCDGQVRPKKSKLNSRRYCSCCQIFRLSSNQDVVKVMGTLVLDATDLLNLKERYEIAPLQTTVVLYPARD